MIFSFRLSSIYSWEFWLILIIMVMVPVLIFFLSMRDTHRVLSAEKKRELALVQERVVRSSRLLMETSETSQDAGMLGAEINALAAYEERLLGRQHLALRYGHASHARILGDHPRWRGSGTGCFRIRTGLTLGASRPFVYRGEGIATIRREDHYGATILPPQAR